MQDTRWIDRNEYPFQPHFLDLEMGRMHYVDEGQGRALVMVHGTPTWSFLFRHLIKGLSTQYRCIAPDHLGFGLSDKPADGSYRPEDHAQNLSQLIESLGLKEITLLVHDFGGPIGLSYALEHPDNVKQLILSNTWMWSLRGDPHFERPGKWLGGSVGRWLYERCNFGVQIMMKRLSGSRLSDTSLRHYSGALSAPEGRHASWVLARELIGSSDWFAGLMRQNERIKDIPTLILWGLRDRALPKKLLQNWSLLMTHAKITTFADAGHFVFEDQGAALCPLIAGFLADHPAPAQP
jgi:haloalkane dehalogenase